MSNPWAQHVNGLHKFRPDGEHPCADCGVPFLDAAGLCPGPLGDEDRAEMLARVWAGPKELGPAVPRRPVQTIHLPGDDDAERGVGAAEVYDNPGLNCGPGPS